MSQIWLDSDSNESSQSRVGCENQGYEFESESNHADRHLSQSWVDWILLESTLRHWFFLGENVEILHLSITLQSPAATFDRPPPPFFLPNQVKCDESWVRFDSTLAMSWVRVESGLVNFGFWVESELSQFSKFGIWVESEMNHLDCHMSQSRVSPKKNESSTTLIAALNHDFFVLPFLPGDLRCPWPVLWSQSTGNAT